MDAARILSALVAAALAFAPRSGAAQTVHPRGWLGVALGPSATTPGARVDHVVRGSPTNHSGIHAADQIRRVDGVTVSNGREFVRAVSLHAAGDSVTLTLARVGKEEQLTVVLADFPSPDAMLRMDHVGIAAPAWVGLEPPGGFPGSVAALRGRVVIVDFWAKWCGPCRILGPILSDWQGRYGAQGLSIVGITTDSAEDAALYKEREDLRYPVASDPRAETSSAYGVSALPTLYVIDKRGIVRDLSIGVDPDQDAHVEDLIRSLLAEPSAP